MDIGSESRKHAESPQGIFSMHGELAKLAGTRFSCICADPPWAFRTYAPPKDPASSRSVERHYKTMTLTEIANLNVKSVCAKDCHLFLWSTGPFLPTVLSIMECWGFQYSSIAFTWVKMRRAIDARQFRFLPSVDGDFHVGLGFTTRKNAEFCLLGRRGSPRRLAKDVRELIVSPVREHSRKPDEFYQRVERYAQGPYLDLFSRIERPGWTTLGDQAGEFKTEVKNAVG